MAEFKIIETQEEFDARISERLKRDRESFAKKFEGYKSPEDIQKITDGLNAQIKALEEEKSAVAETLKEKDAKIAESEKYRTDLAKTRIALKAGLDIKYADRLRGADEKEWEADAKELAKDFAASRYTPPAASHEPVSNPNNKHAAQNAAFKNMLSNLEE